MATDTANRHPAQRLQEGYDVSREMVQEHPLPAALTVFGLGFGLGVALGVMLADSDGSSRFDSRFDSNRWEQFGRQMVEAVSRAVPEALARRMS